jgi:hypothetical protein
MTVTASLAFPGSRILAGWWKRLAPLQPQAWWVGRLFLHRITAPVLSERTTSIDQLSLFVLKALSFEPDANPDRLDRRLHLGRPMVLHLLRQLHAQHLVQAGSGDNWSVTATGKQASGEGRHTEYYFERRAFCFVDNETSHSGFRFLNLQNRPPTLPWPNVDGRRFDIRALKECVQQPAEWKDRFGFPRDVRTVLDTEPSATDTPSPWQRIVFDQPEQLVAVFVLGPGANGKHILSGYAIQQEGWQIHTGSAAFVLSDAWEETLPDLATGTTGEIWRQAWQSWGMARALPAAEIDGCIVECEGYRLHVHAPARLVERLRLSRSEVFKGDAWLLAGAGRIRGAARIELTEMSQQSA